MPTAIALARQAVALPSRQNAKTSRQRSMSENRDMD